MALSYHGNPCLICDLYSNFINFPNVILSNCLLPSMIPLESCIALICLYLFILELFFNLFFSLNLDILNRIVQLFCKTSPNWPQLDSGYTFGAIIPQKWCGVLLSAHIRRHRMSLSPISGDYLVRWCPPGFPIVKFLLLFLWLIRTLWGDAKKHVNVFLIKFCQPLTLASIHNSCHHSCKMVKKTHLSGLFSTDCNIFF